MKEKKFSLEIGGKMLTAIFSDLAGQASGSAMLQMGDTIVLATAVMSKEKREGIDFFPLIVDYEERFYASGQILGSRFVRREGRPTDTAIVSGRMVDRTIRPLFDQRLRNEVQIIITVLSLGADDPDILAINAASLALLVSDIPWNGPVSAVRISNETLNLVVAGKDGAISMIEAGAREENEGGIAEALGRALLEIEILQKFQKNIALETGKKKRPIEYSALSQGAESLFQKEIYPKLSEAIYSGEAGWRTINALGDEWSKIISQEISEEPKQLVLSRYEEAVNEALHKGTLEDSRRADGRGFDELRNLYAKPGGFAPMLHGSGIFYRGETHVLSVLTLGGPDSAQTIDSMGLKEKRHFMHHYNFPPFSSGETGRVGNTNRREIGHGALAGRALSAVLPDQNIFPYTIRLVSESMSSNGSTSMASVCAGSLALMDGGVPITRPVAGIAMGLIYKNKKEYKILTDIQGPEDHHGDMDFKVAGTREGITVVQMDIKVDSIPLKVLTEALSAARVARLKIIDVIEKAISAPRSSLSPHAPRVLVSHINPEKIGAVIGPGGKIINAIKDEAGAEEITIENDGKLTIVGKNGSAEMALSKIESLTREYKKGERFLGTVTRIVDFGAFVEIAPGAEGLAHISELAPFRIEKVTDVLSVGARVPVIIKYIDERGRISLSIKEADPNFIKQKEGTTDEKEAPSNSK